MKIISLIISMSLLLGYQVTYGQENMQEQWIATVSAGIGKHDKRLFDYPEKETLLEMQPENWGTYNFNIGVQRRIWKNQRFSGFVGTGVGYENATFIRPFNHRFFDRGIALDILLHLNRYKKIYTPISLSLYYELSTNWIIAGEMSSDILLYRNINHTENNDEAFPYQAGTFELDKIFLNAEIKYKIGKILVGINSRVLNFQKIDKIIFNNYLKDPRTDLKWEWYNPLRFNFTMSYIW